MFPSLFEMSMTESIDKTQNPPVPWREGYLLKSKEHVGVKEEEKMGILNLK